MVLESVPPLERVHGVLVRTRMQTAVEVQAVEVQTVKVQTVETRANVYAQSSVVFVSSVRQFEWEVAESVVDVGWMCCYNGRRGHCRSASRARGLC